MECIDLADADALDAGGVWVVVAEFDGRGRAWRFADVRYRPGSAGPAVGGGASDGPDGDALLAAGQRWDGPAPGEWRSSMTRTEYLAGVAAVRDLIRAGEVYQVNLCRVLAAPLRPPPASGATEPDAAALGARLAAAHPAPFAGGIHVPAGHPAGLAPAWLVSASPELFLRVADGRITSGPIKGTAVTRDGLSAKDVAENVMIADMVRNDLQRVCAPGTVEVADLLQVQHHPGLVHLVTTVTGRLLEVGWGGVLAATFPPASVSGAPKHTALQAIARLEPTPRGPYCGAFGWVDADRGRAELAVAIRSFWWDATDATVRFGTGAGITWDSDAAAEWAETELKAERLVHLASGTGARMGTVDGGSGA